MSPVFKELIDVNEADVELASSSLLSQAIPETKSINFDEYDLDEKYAEKVIRSLELNQIPIQFAEKEQILEPKSELNAELESALRPIVTRLIEAVSRTDHAKKHFQAFTEELKKAEFIFSAKEDANAGVFKFTSPPIIALNKGLLFGPQAVKSVDVLAFIIAHELSHKALELNLGVGRNSKGEEALADALGLELAHHAGFDARESLRYFRETRVKPSTPDGRFNELIDVHPSPQVRIGLLEAGLTALEKTVEKLNISPTPIARTELPGLAEKIVFTPLREPSAFLKSFEVNGGNKNEIPTIKKLEALALAFETADFNDYRTLKDITETIISIKLDKSDSQQLSRIDDLANRAIALFEGKFTNSIHITPLKLRYGKQIYDSLSDAMQDESTSNAIPLGRFRELDKAIENFVAGSAKEERIQMKTEIHAKAVELMRIFDSETLINSELVKMIRFSNFRFDAKKGAVVSWQQHFEATRGLGTEKKEPVIRALLASGVQDVRLFSEMSLPLYLRVIEGEERSLPELFGVTKNGDRVKSGNLEINGSGCITELGKNGSLKETELRNLRYSKLPQLAENLFKQLPDRDVDARSLEALKKATAVLRQIYEKNGAGAEFLIGLKHLHKNPALFCEINHFSIRSFPELQFLLTGQLDSYLKSNQPNVREIIRTCLSVEKDNGTNPFHYDVTNLDNDGIPRKDREMWESREVVLINFPVARFLLGLPEDIVSSSEKVAMLLEPHIGDQGMGIEVCSAARLKVVKSILASEFPEFVKQSASFTDLFDKHDKMSKDPRSSLTDKQIFSILEAEFRNLAIETGKQPSIDDLLRLSQLQPEWLIAYDPPLADYLRDKYFKRLPILPEDPDSAVAVWIILHESALIPPESIYSMLSGILEETALLKDSTKAEGVYLSILQGHRIVDPIVRDQCIELWADTVKINIGKDDGSQKFLDNLIETVGNLEDIDLVLKEEVLNTLGKKLNTQRQATKILEAARAQVNRDDLEKTQLRGIGLEEVLNLTRREPETRDSVLRFLTNPLTDDSISEFLTLFPDTDTSTSNSFGVVILPTAFDSDLWQRYQEKFKQESANQLHRNFWAAPFEVRTLLAREMFLPPEETSPEQEEKIFKMALEQAFPSKVGHGAQAQEFVRAYIKNVPEYSKHLSIAALMVAAERSNNASAGVGYALASFLETMGPAETKAGQAAQSHPSVPQDIREDLRRLKTKADEPTRWGLWQTIDENIPEEIKSNIASVDQVLGSASFYVVVSVTMKDQSQKVLALLRNHALSRAENGFGLMSAMAADLGTQHKAFNTLEDLIDQAQALAKVESNPIISKEQINIARTIYNGSSVTVGNKTYQFHVPAVESVGSTFRLMEKVEGEHFIDLKESDEKRNIAKAIAAFELSNIIKGLPFDDDRHGGNCKIVGDNINHYDFGGMRLEEPTEKELSKFAEVMLNVLSRVKAEGDLAQEYFVEIKRIREEDGHVPDMIKSVQKALLSLGEYKQHFKEGDLEDVLASVVGQGAHPIIMSAAMARLMQMNGPASLPPGFIMKVMNPPIKIDRTRAELK
jgi:hypothetical protein